MGLGVEHTLTQSSYQSVNKKTHVLDSSSRPAITNLLPNPHLGRAQHLRRCLTPGSNLGAYLVGHEEAERLTCALLMRSNVVTNRKRVGSYSERGGSI